MDYNLQSFGNRKIEQELQREIALHTIDLSAGEITLPMKALEHIRRLPFGTGKSLRTPLAVPHATLMDLPEKDPGTRPPAFGATRERLYIHIADEPGGILPEQTLQIASIQFNPDTGKALALQIDVGRKEFLVWLERLGCQSSLLNALKTVDFPKNFPDTPLNLSTISGDILKQAKRDAGLSGFDDPRFGGDFS